jgi:hypothetical protein
MVVTSLERFYITALMKRITFPQAKSLLRYDPYTGRLYWLVQKGRCAAGSEAGTISCRDEYRARKVHIDGHKYSVGQIAWLLMTRGHPLGIVDFRNDDPLDTRWINLVLTDPGGRNRHASLRKTNKTGAPDVHFWRGKWRARITVDGKRQWLGYFNTRQAAIAARRRATPPR